MHALDGWEWLFVDRRPELSALLIHSPGEGLGYQVQGSRDISIIPQHMIKCMVLYKVYGAIMLCAICKCLDMLYVSREGRCK